MDIMSHRIDYDAVREMKKEQRILFFRRFISNKLAVLGFTLTMSMTIIAMFASIIATHDPYIMEVTDRLQGPSAQYLLGTDNLGRDLLSRIVFGAQVSMLIGIAVTVSSAILGMIIGLYAAYYRGLDNILMRIADGLMAFPSILLAIAIMAALGARTENIIIALTIVNAPRVARLVRSAALVVKEQTYIESMKALGAPDWRIIWKHVMPNTLSPLIVQATFIFAQAIIMEAALSFLGVGVPAPFPSWGNIVHDGKVFIYTSWWMTVFPGIAIFVSVLGLNLFGDGLRDLLDPHTKALKYK